MNRNTLALIVCVCLGRSSLLAAAASPAPIDLSTFPAPVRVACVGDSITSGFGVGHGQSYPDQLQALLGDKWQVKNFGSSGRTLLKKGDHPYWKEKVFTDAQSFRPDVVIIMLGTNDTKPQNWVHRDEFVSDYKDLVETFKNLESKPHVFVCLPCPVIDPGKYGIVSSNLEVEVPEITQLAAQEKVALIDIHAALLGHPELFPDHVHPNVAGTAVMAQTIAAALTGKAASNP